MVLEDITGRPYRVSVTDRSDRIALTGFLLGATGMFATMYSTQAILPELGSSFGVGPARAGLTVSVLIFAIALGAWLWGPLSDRIGRRRALITASALLVVPAALAPLAPSFGLLLACRIAQGLCMPGLLTVGVPYVMATFGRRYGARVMGWYVGALVVGGLIGRVGVSLLTAAVGWRGALGAIALLPLAATIVMQRSLPSEEAPAVERPALRVTLAAVSRNRTLLAATALGAGLFFSFVGIFSYAEYRLQRPPFSLGDDRLQPDLPALAARRRRPRRGARRGAVRLAAGRDRRRGLRILRCAADAAGLAADDVRRPGAPHDRHVRRRHLRADRGRNRDAHRIRESRARSTSARTTPPARSAATSPGSPGRRSAGTA